jgi:hypothetical protein
MNIAVIALGLFFSVLSGGILAYLSVATMIGPWIAPTIALLTNIIYKIKRSTVGAASVASNQQSTALIQAIGAVGGAVGTGIGFAFPVLYFLDKLTFNYLLANPSFFFLLIVGLCLTAGSLGIALGALYAQQFIDKDQLPFPVSQLTYNVISAQSNHTQAVGILIGSVVTILFSVLRDGIGKISGVIPKNIYLFTPYLNNEFAIALWPTLWSIGFSSGTGLIVPILLGIFSKYVILFPLNNHAHYLPISLFQPMSISTITVAFCSGIVLSEIIVGLTNYVKSWFKALYKSKKALLESVLGVIDRYYQSCKKITLPAFNRQFFLMIGILAGSICFLTILKFPFFAQIIFLVTCTIATYQICFIGGKIGLIQYGRFSTYILIPMYLLFDLSSLQLTVVCVFFNICAATASDLLFDFKTGVLANIPRKNMWFAQWIGLLGVTVTIGAIFYLLFTNLLVGSSEFFAQRSQAKALLLQTMQFNVFVVLFGFLYGLLIKRCGLSPTMVFGGIIMPNTISIGLIIGATLSFFSRSTEKYLPFCAGVFACESLWIFINIFIKKWLI